MTSAAPEGAPGLREAREARTNAPANLRRPFSVISGLAALTALTLPVALRPTPRLVWNVTPSTPTGLYRVSPGGSVKCGALVVAWLPDTARALADQRRYVPAAVPVVKRIAAVAGDRVCAVGPWLTIAGVRAARRLARDRLGRPLPAWAGCRVLAPSEILLLGDAPDSFDGRYFGPQPRANILGIATLLWPR